MEWSEMGLQETVGGGHSSGNTNTNLSTWFQVELQGDETSATAEESVVVVI
jgi:hypothetical protein